MSVVLVTGFEAFGGESVNASRETLAALEERPVSGFQLHTGLLPVDSAVIRECISSSLSRCRPDVLIMLGQAGGRSAICLERAALNILDFPIPDNAGNQPADTPIVEGGPAAFFSTLPLRPIIHTLERQGIPAVISNTAGTYLCNQVMYLALYEIMLQKWQMAAGFIHLPLLPVQASRQNARPPSLPLDLMVGAVYSSIQESLGHLRMLRMQ